MSSTWTAMSAAVTVLTLLALVTRLLVTAYRGEDGRLPRVVNLATLLLVVTFFAAMLLRLSTAA